MWFLNKRIVYVTLLLLLGNVMLGQTVQFIDSGTKRGISNVTLEGKSAVMTSDKTGSVDLTGFDVNDTVLVAHMSYYEQLLPISRMVKLGVIELKGRSYIIPEVVISASKWEQAEEKVADQITVLDARDIELANAGTAADLLASSGEVYVQKSQAGGGSPMIRGFSANRLLIVVDGVRMNNAIYRSGNLQNVLNVDPNVLQRAEVVHGPGAVTYGSDAIGGVMDFHTFDPQFLGDSTPFVSGAGFYRYTDASAERTYHGRLNFAWRKAALLVSVSRSTFGSPRMGANGRPEYLRSWFVTTINGQDSIVANPDPLEQVGNEFELRHTLLKFRWKPDDAWDVILSGRASSTPAIPRYDRLIQLRDGLPRFAEWDYSDQSWAMGNIRVENHRASGLWDNARLTLAVQEYIESRTDRRYRSTIRSTSTEEVNGIWLNLDFEKQLPDSTQLFYGIESVTNNVSSNAFQRDIFDTDVTNTTIINPRYPDDSDWYTHSAYANVSRNLTETLLFNGGLRFNLSGLNVKFDTTLFPYPVVSSSLANEGLTGGLGLIWNPSDKQKWSVDISRGFRSPNIDDIGKVFDSEPGAVIVPNVDLGPEYVTSFEIGVQRKLGTNLKLNVNGYYTILENAIVRRNFQVEGQDSILFAGELSAVLALQNAAIATVAGVHLGLDWKRLAWNITLDVNVQDGEEETDDGETSPARHAPPAFGRIMARWEKKRLTFSFFANASAGFGFEDLALSERNKPHIYAIDENGNPFSPAWYTVGANGEYKVHEHITVAAGVENITDQRYRTYSSGVVAPGRNVQLTLRASF